MSSKTIAILSSALLTSAVLGSGCTGREEEQKPPVSLLDSEQGFCQKLGEVICNPDVVEACYLSDDASLDADTQKCIDAAASNACNPSGHDYNKAAANPCLTAIQKMYQDAKLERVELEEAREACLATFPGSGGEGSACSVDEDCDGAEGLRCVSKPGAAGSCRVPVEVEPAADCSSPASVCPSELYCDAGEHCVARQDPGDACSDTMLCVDTARCVSDVCLGKADNGETCSSEDECLGGFCIKKAGEASGQCGAFIPLTFDSAACATLGG